MIRTYDTRHTTNARNQQKHLKPYHLAVIRNRSIIVFDDTWTPVQELKAPKHRPTKIVPLASGKLVSFDYESQTSKFYVWETATTKYTIIDVGTEGYYTCVALSNDRLAVGGSHGYFYILDLKTKTFIELVGHKEYIQSIIELSDGRIVSGSGDGSIRLWNTTPEIQSVELVTSPPGFRQINDIVKLPNGNIVAGCRYGTLLIHLESGLVTTPQGTGHNLHTTLLPDGQVAYVCDGPEEVHILNPHSGKYVSLSERVRCVYCMTVLKDGRLACGDYNGVIHIWNLQDLSFITLHGHSDSVRSLWSVDEATLISVSWHEVRCWNLETNTSTTITTGRDACMFHTKDNQARFRQNAHEVLDPHLIDDVQGLVCDYL